MNMKVQFYFIESVTKLWMFVRMTCCLLTVKARNKFGRLLCRFRYPGSLPEDVAKALGVFLPNYICFDEFMNQLTSSGCYPTNLMRWMPRKSAERCFDSAIRKEAFGSYSIFSYYFRRGWLEFVLHFDDQSRLRRIYLQHRDIGAPRGIELSLKNFEQETLCSTSA